ncbi:MAG: type II toxin-antitoxin system Phd/YefM family antitoxin [Paraglaciecola sp.]|nr:type II toxin-antitoxin system Phd/YefM family antitoxin [Paraglaciecola sp.]NCT48630.1 type II toxin-antitoxin system Phd/YefM family antitoxin [Paraglaciecola sp.]
MRTETITYLKENANNLSLDEKLIVTKNGKAAFVVQSIEDYEYQQNTLALLKLLKLAEKSVSEKPLSLDEAFS